MQSWTLMIERYTALGYEVRPIRVYADDVRYNTGYLWGIGITKTVTLYEKYQKTVTSGMLWWKSTHVVDGYKIIGSYDHCQNFYKNVSH